MSSESEFHNLVQRFEDVVWQQTAPQLASEELRIWAECWQPGLTIRHVVAEQADETLVLAIQKNFFSRPAFTELLPIRYGKRLSRWFVRFGTEWNSAQDLAQGLMFRFYRRQLKSFNPNQ